MKVFKFGGASVKDAAAVKNAAEIIRKFPNEKIQLEHRPRPPPRNHQH